MRAALLAVAVAALVLPSVAIAHVTVLPAYLEDGQRSTLVFSAPNERAPHAVMELTVTVPAGVELRTTTPPPGWRLELGAGKATWSGGRTGPHEVGQFRVEAKTELSPTAVTFRAVQRYDDAATVRWTIPFTILPASHPPKQHLWRAFIAGAIGFVAIVGGLAFLRLRRPLRSDRAP